MAGLVNSQTFRFCARIRFTSAAYSLSTNSPHDRIEPDRHCYDHLIVIVGRESDPVRLNAGNAANCMAAPSIALLYEKARRHAVPVAVG
jgi:hypothetical protein